MVIVGGGQSIATGHSPSAGRRVVGVPDAIIPTLRDHLWVYVKDEPGALVFPRVRGGPLRRGNFNKMSAWPHAVASIELALSAWEVDRSRPIKLLSSRLGRPPVAVIYRL